MTQQAREELCRMFVRRAMTRDISPTELAATHRVIHKLEMKNCTEMKSLSSINKRRKQYEISQGKSA